MISYYFRRGPVPSARLPLGTDADQGRISAGGLPTLRPLLTPVPPAAGGDRLRGGLPPHQPLGLQLQLLPLQEQQPLPPHHSRPCQSKTFIKDVVFYFICKAQFYEPHFTPNLKKWRPYIFSLAIEVSKYFSEIKFHFWAGWKKGVLFTPFPQKLFFLA
jgi:hypothetical protein